MTEKVNYLTVIVGAVGGFFAYWLGGWDILLKTVLACTVIDFITGVLEALYKGECNAKECGDGIIRKVLMYLVIALSFVLQTGSGIDIPIREVTIMFYIAQESISVLENVGGIVNYPEKLRNMLKQLSGGEQANE